MSKAIKTLPEIAVWFTTLAKFIAGLGIPMVGRHAGRELDKCFCSSWTAFEQAIHNGFDFTSLPGFGTTMHDNIYKWYADPEEAKLWRPPLDHITFTKENSTMGNTNNPFAGKTVVATGKLVNYTRVCAANSLTDIQTRLPWPQASDILSECAAKHLGHEITCKALEEGDDYWCCQLQGYGMPLPELCRLMFLSGLPGQEWDDTLPDEGGSTVDGLGMHFCEHLISHHLGLG